MKIAVPHEKGMIFQHFGHSREFKLYEVENGSFTKIEILPTGAGGHGALADLLSRQGVEVLICGGIGDGAKNALQQAGIKLFGGVSGSADRAVAAFAANALEYDPNVRCDHHDKEHGDYGHSCGEQGCGSGHCGK